jgi:hypothetical protein
MFPSVGRSAGTVPVIKYQEVIEALATHGAKETFADGVRVRRAHRRADHADAGGTSEGIEGGPELAVAIANQKPRRGT